MNTITIINKPVNKLPEHHKTEYVINSIRDFEIQNKKVNIGKT